MVNIEQPPIMAFAQYTHFQFASIFKFLRVIAHIAFIYRNGNEICTFDAEQRRRGMHCQCALKALPFKFRHPVSPRNIPAAFSGH
jgi:hypothetical protein